jgi:hypothetical protein
MSLVIPRHRLLKAIDSRVSGRSADGKRWAISPDGSDEVLQLVFGKEFGLLVDLSANPDNN